MYMVSVHTTPSLSIVAILTGNMAFKGGDVLDSNGEELFSTEWPTDLYLRRLGEACPLIV